MARKQRNDIDYFPHSVKHGKKMFFMRTKYKNDGYAVWFLLLEELGKADNHFLDLQDEIEIMYLSSSFMIEQELLINIIEDLVKLEEFDKELWERESILYNQTFVDNIADAYKKRVNECVTRTSLIDDLMNNGRWIEPKKTKKATKPQRIGDGNPQTKGKDIKEEENKSNKSVALPFQSDIFFNAWETWKEYKRIEKGFRYKSPISEQTSLKKLEEFSSGNEKAALMILENSIANGWTGFFKLQNQPTNSNLEPSHIERLNKLKDKYS